PQGSQRPQRRRREAAPRYSLKDGLRNCGSGETGVRELLLKLCEVRDIGTQDSCLLQRVQRRKIERRGKEPALPSGETCGAVRPPEIAAAPEDDEQLKMFGVGGKFASVGKLQPLRGEIVARAQKLRFGGRAFEC